MDGVPALLNAIHHPDNSYVLHLDAAATVEEERSFNSMFGRPENGWGNVAKLEPRRRVIYSGVSMLDITLSALTVLLGMGKWSFFINLCPNDHPTVPPSTLRHILGLVPSSPAGHLSFVSHANGAWHEEQRWWAETRLGRLVVDTSIHLANGAEVRDASGDSGFRELPTAFDVFHGDPWAVLGRVFAEYLILATDGWPRRALLYFAGAPVPIEHYFPTVLCNSAVFRHLVIRDSLRFVKAVQQEVRGPQAVANATAPESVGPQQSPETPATVAAIADADVPSIVKRGFLFAVVPSGGSNRAAAAASRKALNRHITKQLSSDAQSTAVIDRAKLRLEFLLANNATCDWV